MLVAECLLDRTAVEGQQHRGFLDVSPDTDDGLRANGRAGESLARRLSDIVFRHVVHNAITLTRYKMPTRSGSCSSATRAAPPSG